MYALRLFASRHANVFAKIYKTLESVFSRFHPLMQLIGYGRLEKPVALVERAVKGVLFDCQMCGQCVLSSTGMACPMNCPKNLRNGPCGGVRDGGFCEVLPNRRCVWVEAWEGAARMPGGIERIKVVQPPVNRQLEGSSSWLRALRERAAMAASQHDAADGDKAEMASSFAAARKLHPSTTPVATEPQSALAEQSVSESTSVFVSPQQGARDVDTPPDQSNPVSVDVPQPNPSPSRAEKTLTQGAGGRNLPSEGGNPVSADVPQPKPSPSRAEK